MHRFDIHPFWKGKRLSPGQFLIRDVTLSQNARGGGEKLEINEVPLSAIVPQESEQWGEQATSYLNSKMATIYGVTRSEHQRLNELSQEYGWMNNFRIPADKPGDVMCRHISSTFPDNIHGVLLGLRDWGSEREKGLEALRTLDQCLYKNERFSNHGKYFQPFFSPLNTADSPESTPKEGVTPSILCLPFLDWTVYPGPTPELRFQIDKREDRSKSARSSSHPIRSLLQYYYRLEDTADREKTQVFARHRPWDSDRELYLKVQRWYGHPPSGLAVDELWVLVIDQNHIVTFSGNQSWKSRWPPLQLPSRIEHVSFRQLRSNFLHSRNKDVKYNALMQAIACIHGAVGMLHRSFWVDIALPLTDRYGGYLGHLQYKLHRAPNSKLVTDLLQIQDELNIVVRIMRKQEEVVNEFKEYLESRLLEPNRTPSRSKDVSTESQYPVLIEPNDKTWLNVPTFSPYSHSSTSQDPIPSTGHKLSWAFTPPDPIDEVLDMLRRELDDIRDLKENSSELITRTVQLVNIRIEDHGQAILIFTFVTMIFLPLSTVSSYLGMNVTDVRLMTGTSKWFWIWGVVLTVSVLLLSSLLACYSNTFLEFFLNWRQNHNVKQNRKNPGPKPQNVSSRIPTKQFAVLDPTTSGIHGMT